MRWNEIEEDNFESHQYPKEKKSLNDFTGTNFISRHKQRIEVDLMSRRIYFLPKTKIYYRKWPTLEKWKVKRMNNGCFVYANCIALCALNLIIKWMSIVHLHNGFVNVNGEFTSLCLFMHHRSTLCSEWNFSIFRVPSTLPSSFQPASSVRIGFRWFSIFQTKFFFSNRLEIG